MTKPIPCNLGKHGPTGLNLVHEADRRVVLRMLGSISSPGEYGANAFEKRVDLNTLRAVVLTYRHVETGLWQLRIDGLVLPPCSVFRDKDCQKVWYHSHPELAFRHWGGDYGGLECFRTPFSKQTLPDGTSRLLARTMAHFASQIWGEDKIASWAEPSTSGAPVGPNVAPLPDRLRDLL